jgi:hypothetical protein
MIAMSTATGPLIEFCSVWRGASHGKPVVPVVANTGLVKNNMTIPNSGTCLDSFLIEFLHSDLLLCVAEQVPRSYD